MPGGTEYVGCQDIDGDTKPDANDTDRDNDGITDGVEDKNFNGRLDAGETDRLGTDTDDDGLADGLRRTYRRISLRPRSNSASSSVTGGLSSTRSPGACRW